MAARTRRSSFRHYMGTIRVLTTQNESRSPIKASIEKSLTKHQDLRLSIPNTQRQHRRSTTPRRKVRRTTSSPFALQSLFQSKSAVPPRRAKRPTSPMNDLRMLTRVLNHEKQTIHARKSNEPVPRSPDLSAFVEDEDQNSDQDQDQDQDLDKDQDQAQSRSQYRNQTQNQNQNQSKKQNQNNSPGNSKASLDPESIKVDHKAKRKRKTQEIRKSLLEIIDGQGFGIGDDDLDINTDEETSKILEESRRELILNQSFHNSSSDLSNFTDPFIENEINRITRELHSSSFMDIRRRQSEVGESNGTIRDTEKQAEKRPEKREQKENSSTRLSPTPDRSKHNASLLESPPVTPTNVPRILRRRMSKDLSSFIIQDQYSRTLDSVTNRLSEISHKIPNSDNVILNESFQKELQKTPDNGDFLGKSFQADADQKSDTDLSDDEIVETFGEQERFEEANSFNIIDKSGISEITNGDNNNKEFETSFEYNDDNMNDEEIFEQNEEIGERPSSESEIASANAAGFEQSGAGTEVVNETRTTEILPLKGGESDDEEQELLETDSQNNSPHADANTSSAKTSPNSSRYSQFSEQVRRVSTVSQSETSGLFIHDDSDDYDKEISLKDIALDFLGDGIEQCEVNISVDESTRNGNGTKEKKSVERVDLGKLPKRFVKQLSEYLMNTRSESVNFDEQDLELFEKLDIGDTSKRERINDAVLDIICQCSDRFLSNQIRDLKDYATHAKRKTINSNDMVLLLKRTKAYKGESSATVNDLIAQAQDNYALFEEEVDKLERELFG